jgi:hypothetical protein
MDLFCKSLVCSPVFSGVQMKKNLTLFYSYKVAVKNCCSVHSLPTIIHSETSFSVHESSLCFLVVLW